MPMVVLSVLLTLAALAGLVLNFSSRSLMTVDGLFYTLILGTMFALFGANSFYELRRLRLRRAGPHQSATAPPAKRESVTAPAQGATAPGAAAPTPPAADKNAASTAAAPARAPEPSAPSATELAQQQQREKPPTIEGFTTGTVLVRSNAPLFDADIIASHACFSPEGVAAARANWCTDWKVVECGSAAALERPLRQAGLDIFYLVGALEGSGWAFNRKGAVRKALAPVLAAVDSRGRNAVEIARIAVINILGVSHVTVVAHACHIQKTPFLLDPPGTPPPVRVPRAVAEDTADRVAPARAA